MTVCVIIACAVLVAVAAAAARALRSPAGRPGRRPGPPAAGPGTGHDHWYSPSCETLHDIAPEMLVRPYTVREAARGHDRATMRPRQR